MCALAQQIYTIQLQHRSSEEIVKAIHPLLPTGTKIQTFDNKLILNTTAENYATLKNVVNILDVAAIQLRIKLYNGNIAPSNTASISKNKYELGTSSLEQDNRYVRSTSREGNRKTDELLVMSGEVAIIETQVTLPLLNSQYAYRDKSNSSNTYQNTLASESTENKIKLPTASGVKIIIPNTEDKKEKEENKKGKKPKVTQQSDEEQPIGDALLSIEDPVTTKLPINIPNVPGETFEIENEKSTTQSKANEDFQYQADRGASEQFYQYHQLDSGLMVRPVYMKGSKKVLLEFLTKSTQIDHQNQMNDKAYSQFKVGSKMMVPMNKWVYVGGNRIDKPSAKKYEYRTQSREKKNQHLWVYIETN
tara:strand:- start:2730 stop:3818 length:1089 start_codon:yes stop_codon:yes gene_type:complete